MDTEATALQNTIRVVLDDLIFLHGGHTERCIATVDKHFDYHTLQLMTGGAVELSYDDHRYELHDRWMWPCYPGPLIRFHEWPRGCPWTHRYVAFTGPRVAGWEADGLWPTAPMPVPARAAEPYAELFDQVIDLALRPGRWPLRRATNLIERLLLEWAESARTADPEPEPWLAAVMQTLSSQHEQPDYGELARSIGMSPTTLRRRFRAATGRTPHQYHLECRVAEARRMLGETDEPIKQIARHLGYRDVFYFTRQFSQVTGASPAVYRRSRQR